LPRTNAGLAGSYGQSKMSRLSRGPLSPLRSALIESLASQ
jgi:hypothetical protein